MSDPKHPSRNADDIAQQLDVILEAEFSFLKTLQPAQIIAGLERREQEFILTWVKRVSSTNIQLAYQFMNEVIGKLAVMDKKIIEAWALHAMDIYDQDGMYPALEVLRHIDRFIHHSHQRTAGAVLEDIIGVLAHFTHGLSGRALTLQEADEVYTDTETIYLPPLIGRLPNTEDNFKIYKAMVAYHWAQVRFGTFRESLACGIADRPQPQRFLALFHSFERLRLEAHLARELPGLYRDMQRLLSDLGETLTPPWQIHARQLTDPHLTVQQVIELTAQHLDSLDPLPRCFYQGPLRLEKVAACQQQRIEKEKAQLRSLLRHFTEEIKGKQGKDASEYHYEARQNSSVEDPVAGEIELTLDGQPMPVPEHAKALLTSIMQDFGEIPPEYLTPAGPGEYDPALFAPQHPDPDEVWKGTYHEEGAFLYNEWDYKRQHYRKNWCAVREKDIAPVLDDFVAKTLRKYSGLVKHLRKTFEAMRDEDRLLKRQVHGDDVDIDALVEALADSKDGSEMSDRLFTRMHRSDRNIAVLFMVDMSGSTKGWINEAEREALILLAETLELLGDRYAIYGFSGTARKRCEIYRIKHFDEPYHDDVKARISGITPKDYTRMGFALRHLSRLLNEAEAKTRILITISDGKPDDYDHYRGEYGIEDTRRALIEARRSGIHPYCITIDKEGRDYLPHMYGPASYTVIDDVAKLPLKVSDIYRRITT
ncbi:MAG: VWA domain-containing protein [Gammaproteobacteria bacterium]|nr:VWA domain-containing protein [Gammaproteobacteria bacterium]